MLLPSVQAGQTSAAERGRGRGGTLGNPRGTRLFINTALTQRRRRGFSRKAGIKRDVATGDSTGMKAARKPHGRFPASPLVVTGGLPPPPPPAALHLDLCNHANVCPLETWHLPPIAPALPAHRRGRGAAGCKALSPLRQTVEETRASHGGWRTGMGGRETHRAGGTEHGGSTAATPPAPAPTPAP